MTCLTSTAGRQSPDNTTLSQVLDPHKYFGPYKCTDGSFLTLHSKIQNTPEEHIAISDLPQLSSRPHGGGPVSSMYAQNQTRKNLEM